MTGIRVYLNERFPIAAVAPLSLATAAMMAGVAGSFDHPSGYALAAICMASAMFFFLLRQRVTDEFKDSAHDTANYPNRPVQRGVISRRTLVQLGLVAFAAELASVAGAGLATGRPTSIVWYLPFLAYSAATAREFFVGEWLDRHFNIYFVSHQGIFVAYAAWGFAVFGNPIDAKALGAALAFVLFMVSVEVARKYEIRLDPAGNPVQDTYLTVWGRVGSGIVTAAVTLVGTALLYWQTGSVWHLVGEVVLVIALLNRGTKPQALRAVIILNFILQSVVSFVA